MLRCSQIKIFFALICLESDAKIFTPTRCRDARGEKIAIDQIDTRSLEKTLATHFQVWIRIRVKIARSYNQEALL